MANLQQTGINDTGFLQVPVGTTGQRLGSPNVGYLRYNTTESYLEVWNGEDWLELGSSSNFDTFASYVASLPRQLATSSLSGTISTTDAASYGVNLNNNLYYTTIKVDGHPNYYNAIMIYSRQNRSSVSNSRSNANGHNASGMRTIRPDQGTSGFSSSESWVGYNDALELLFPDSSSYYTVMGVLGPSCELYYGRNPGVSRTNVFNRNTVTENTDWTQNRSTKSLTQAINNTGYRTNKTNGPWSSGHYGPWGWDTAYSNPGNSNCLKSTLYGNSVSTTDDGIFIFERNDNASYQPGEPHAMFVFYPDYPQI